MKTDLIRRSDVFAILRELSDLADACEAESGHTPSAQEALDAAAEQVRELTLDAPRKGPPAPLFAGPN